MVDFIVRKWAASTISAAYMGILASWAMAKTPLELLSDNVE